MIAPTTEVGVEHPSNREGVKKLAQPARRLDEQVAP
jgi:hypothetical protein